jgi:hypothetical protein
LQQVLSLKEAIPSGIFFMPMSNSSSDARAAPATATEASIATD